MIVLSMTVDGVEKAIENSHKFETFFDLSKFVEDLSRTAVKTFDAELPPHTETRLDYTVSTGQHELHSEVFVKPEFKHLFFVDAGTPARIIYGKPILAWTDRATGKKLFATHVEHPAVEGSHWVDRGNQKVALLFQTTSQEILDRL